MKNLQELLPICWIMIIVREWVLNNCPFGSIENSIRVKL
jgi:hypothetical protein